MFSIAYRMLGSVTEAEDVVQEAFLRIHTSAIGGNVVVNPEAFATTITTRLAIDALRSARAKREQYVGEWLPEPLITSVDEDPARHIEMDETVSIAFLTLLERLTPIERAVFLLREVFGYSFAEIAEVVSRSEANCRQLLVRARRRIDQARPRFVPASDRAATLSRKFFAAIKDGDLDELVQMLADDVVFYGDGGGKAPALATPLRGATAVARFLIGVGHRGGRFGMQVELISANGQPAARYTAPGGLIIAVVCLEIVGDRIHAVRNQVNPDKLAHLGPVGDMNALLRSTEEV